MREHYGLPEEVDVARASVQRPGMLVTVEEAEVLDRASAVRDTIDTKELADLFEDRADYLGTRWDPASSTMTVYVTSRAGSSGDRSASNGVEPSTLVPPNPNVVVEVVEASMTAEELRDAQRQLTQKVSELDRHGTIQSTLDETCGKILVVVEDARDLASVKQLAPRDVAGVVLAPEIADRPTDRYDHHHNEQDGGLGLRPYNENNSSYLGDCTSSVGIVSTLGSYEYAVTAGHCLRGMAVASTTRQWQCDVRFTQGGLFLNPTDYCVRYQLGGQVDAAVVAKYTWERGLRRAMIHGGNHTMVSFPGWDGFRSNSAGGDQMCHSGRNWAGSPCGTIQSFNHDVCFTPSNGAPNYCLEDVIDTTMPGIGGDSGAAVWTTRGGVNRYAGIQNSAGGVITHLEDLIDALGLGVPVCQQNPCS